MRTGSDLFVHRGRIRPEQLDRPHEPVVRKVPDTDLREKRSWPKISGRRRIFSTTSCAAYDERARRTQGVR
jgi:hypothetical protein